MTLEAIIETLDKKRRGTISTVYLDRPALVRSKYHGPEIRKKSGVQFLAKVDYSDTNTVRQAVKNGIRPTPQTPSWVEEVVMQKGITFWRKKDQWYLVMVPIKPLKVTWTLDGNTVPKESIHDFLLADDAKESNFQAEKSDRAEKGHSVYIVAKLENISKMI